MKVKLKAKVIRNEEICDITSDFIKLDSLLKFSMAAETGGEAKLMIQDGIVKVNGEVCTQRGRKIYPGDYVDTTGVRIIVKKADNG